MLVLMFNIYNSAIRINITPMMETPMGLDATLICEKKTIIRMTDRCRKFFYETTVPG